MKKILIFLIVYTLLFKTADITFIPLQSLFFVSALKTYGIFASQRPRRNGIVSSFVLLLSGFALTVVLLLYCAETPLRFIYLTEKSINVFSLYLLFFSLILLRYHRATENPHIKPVAILCTVFPALSQISDTVSSFTFSAILVLLSVMILIAAKKGVLKHPSKE